MNRNFSLILSAVIVVILLAIWLYLMFFSSPPNDDLGPIEGQGDFSEFEGLGEDVFGDESDVNDGSNSIGLDEEMYDPDILRQLTTKVVVGYKEVLIDNTNHIIFMEAGVGHIYSINLETGIEERVSATTIPNARAGQFSSDGSMVAVKIGGNTGVQPLSIGMVDFESKTLTLQEIETGVAQFVFADEDLLLYTVVNNSSVSAKVYDPQTAEAKTVFNTPFREAIIGFGTGVEGPHYFWPKTSHVLEGFVYQVGGDTLKRLPFDGFGLTAAGFDDVIIASYRDGDDLITAQHDSAQAETELLNMAIIPDKCVRSVEVLYCAVPQNTELQYKDIDEWYQGVEIFSDNLWLIHNEFGGELINITNHSGRSVDVTNGMVGAISNDWYFQNKTNDSLWIYELSRLSETESSQDEI